MIQPEFHYQFSLKDFEDVLAFLDRYGCSYTIFIWAPRDQFPIWQDKNITPLQAIQMFERLWNHFYTSMRQALGESGPNGKGQGNAIP